MWKVLKIAENNYILRCTIVEENEMECLVFNLEAGWSGKLPFAAICGRAKQLNKRIQFNEDTVRETLLNADVFKACSRQDGIFTFEYRVQNCPFHFEWNLEKLTEKDFRICVMSRIVHIVGEMSEVVSELCEIASKKDLEIEQYKIEGATLRRRTVATPRFDREQFNNKFSAIFQLSMGFSEIVPPVKNAILTSPTKLENADVQNKEGDGKAKESRKRKTPEKIRKHIMRNYDAIKAAKELTYLESESPNLSEGLTQIDWQNHVNVESKKSTRTAESQNVNQSSAVQNTIQSNIAIQDKKADNNQSRTGSARHKLNFLLDKASQESSDNLNLDLTEGETRTRLGLRSFRELRSETITSEQSKKKNQKPKLQEEEVQNDAEMNLDDLLGWKRMAKQTEDETVKPLEQILKALKDLNDQRESQI